MCTSHVRVVERLKLMKMEVVVRTVIVMSA